MCACAAQDDSAQQTAEAAAHFLPASQGVVVGYDGH